MKTRESEEMYLETILVLSNKMSSVRSIDIVSELGYAKSSVSRAVNLLKKKEYIIIDNSGAIKLTPIGKAKATDIYEKHKTLTDFFVSLGCAYEIAEQDACKIEHIISAELFNIIKKRNKN